MSASHELSPRAASSRGVAVDRICALAFAVICAGLLIYHTYRYLAMALAAITYPFQLDYGEGIIWQQAMMIPDGRMYGDINQYPFIVFHYPPLYHLSVRLFALLGGSPLLVGRAISFGSAWIAGGCGAAMAWFALRERDGRLAASVAAVAAPLLMFSSLPFGMWSVLMRVDMLEVALSFTAVLCAIHAVSRPRMLYAATLLLSLAIYTKQTAIFAAVATLPVVWVTPRRHVIGAAVLALSLCVAALIALMWATDGGFLRHILLYNINRFALSAASVPAAVAGWHIAYLALAVAALVVGWRRARAGTSGATFAGLRRRIGTEPLTRVLAVLTVYLAASSLSVLGVAKSGSSFNYLIEWMSVGEIAVALLMGWCAAALAQPSRGRHRQALGPLVVFLLVAAQVRMLPFLWSPAELDVASRPDLVELHSLIQRANKPVLSDDMVLLMGAGKTVPWEPAIFAELATLGRWDERQIIDLIRSHTFAFILTTGRTGEVRYDSRYDPAVNAAIEASYPDVTASGGYFVRMPRD